jgi:hypothetical protein
VLATLATACKRNHSEHDRPSTSAQGTAADAQSSATPGPTTTPTTASNPCDEVLYRAPAGDSMQNFTQTTAMLLWRERRGIVAWPKPNGPARVLLANDRVKALAADEQYLYFA